MEPTDEMKYDAAERYRKGAKLQELADLYGVSRQTVYRWVREQKASPRTQWTDEEANVILKLYLENGPQAE